MAYISVRAKNTPPSPIRRLAHLSRAAEERGIRPYYLNIGQPDLPCPAAYIEGLKKYVSGSVAYAPSAGFPELLEVWSGWVNRVLGTSTKPHHYLVTMGASEGLVFLFTTCADPGDEIIIFDPTYANYMGFAEQTGVRLVSLSTVMENNFSLPETEVIVQHITSRSRAILLCNPNNPTGVLYSADELRRLLNICYQYDLYLILDEAYREIVFDGLPITSIMNVAPEDSRVIVVDSLSKRFSLCGARLGSLYVPNDALREKILHLAQARLAAPTLEQLAATYLFQHVPDNYLGEMRAIYEGRRNALISRLSQIPGVTCSTPSGAFYVLAELPISDSEHGDSEHFARYLLSDFSHDGRTVFVAPAKGFYRISGRGTKEVRLAYVLEEERLEDAAALLERALERYREL